MKILRTGFFSRKDMKTPLKVSAFCFLINLILNICLIFPLKERGLALATVLSSFLNCFLLFYILNKELRMNSNQYKELIIDFIKQGICLGVFGMSLFLSLKFVLPMFNQQFKTHIFLTLMITCILSTIAMLIMMLLLRTKELKELKKIFVRR